MSNVAYRSVVPDLIYDDQYGARVESIGPYLRQPHQIRPDFPLHRLTLFVTYRCNLKCHYCKMADLSREKTCGGPEADFQFRLEKFQGLMDGYRQTPPHHLHLTGGEASLESALPLMILYAKRVGVQHVSTTTNGTLPSWVYCSLVEAGLDEIRISLDTTPTLAGQASAAEQRNISRAWNTIRELVEQGRHGRDRRSFVIVNTVVSSRNYRDIPQIVRSILELGVNDLKLIPEIESIAALQAMEREHGIAQELERILQGFPQDAFPLLRLKAARLFDPEPIGLRSIPVAQARDWYCYIPLTERTVDGQFYYPCSVYLREGGKPIGRIDEPAEVQCRKSADFVARGDCLDDPICQRYCLNCIREYNKLANEVKHAH